MENEGIMNNGNGGIVLQAPSPREQNCVVCLQHFKGYGFFNWCSTCIQAWESGTVFERFHETDDDKRSASIQSSWAITRRKEVQREREANVPHGSGS